MIKETIMAKYGEIALKGLNKITFEDILVKNIKARLNPLGQFSYIRKQSTLYITPLTDDADLNEAVCRLQKVFGIAAVQRSLILPKDFDIILSEGLPYLASTLNSAKTFKVDGKRSDKTFRMNTPMIQEALGEAILDRYPHLTVDVHNPDVTVLLEIRDDAAYLNGARLKGVGGIPVGSSGQGLLLLSGGIDSPVAAYMMAKRGVSVGAIHFQSPPYTSERALLKVETLCEKLTNYCGHIRLYIVPFTEIQEALKDNCKSEYFTIIMRRLMIKIANEICEKRRYQALITGESVGQVASQTMGAIACTDIVSNYPIFRPVVGMDKIEITEIARKIDTFETSSLPYEDCCTVFTPKHPRTKPHIEDVSADEASYDYAPLLEKAINGIIIKDFNIA